MATKYVRQDVFNDIFKHVACKYPSRWSLLPTTKTCLLKLQLMAVRSTTVQREAFDFVVGCSMILHSVSKFTVMFRVVLTVSWGILLLCAVLVLCSPVLSSFLLSCLGGQHFIAKRVASSINRPRNHSCLATTRGKLTREAI